MCGIVGIFDSQGQRKISEELLRNMNDLLIHRGPDEGGIHIETGLGFGHRRLSIIDLSSGHQPLFNEDETVVVVYNGEIYNFQELSKELSAAGHQFKTQCDTEVIVHAWEQWGEACVERFRGMFAFSIWDRNTKTLFMARDRLGIKPLYYSFLSDGQFIFASELKSILAFPDLNRDMDSCAIEDYFAYGYIPEPRTILKNVHKLPPGHTLTLRHGAKEYQINEYWDVPFNQRNTDSVVDIQHELIDRLREAVEIRMVADVPLGAFLSGGVDSSAIVALMAELNGQPVNTCSISFGDPKFNEVKFADIVAKQYGTNHYVEQVESDDFDLIDMLAGLYDEPYADSSAIPTYRVCGLARKRVTVAISGDGGDENFAGYRRYLHHRYEDKMRSILPLSIRRPLFGSLGKLYPKADWAPKIFRAKSTFQALSRDSVEGYFHGVSIFDDNLRSQIFSKNFRTQLGGYQAIEVLRYHAARAPTDDSVSLVQYLDMKTYLVGDILTKVDRASMAHGLEVRVPLLDHKFVEWTSGLPTNLKLRGQEGKWIFKKALQPYLSNEILYRRKMGFAVPLAAWFRGPLRERVRTAILGPTLQDSGLFNHNVLQKILDKHLSGQRDYSAPLWSLLMFESFLRNVLDKSGPLKIKVVL
ncbi:amidotransferase 1, exosortase A system-associated [Beggiatoa alba]|nr:amidotransferase 1, exosortase A system-associated [Beggiatoa alba]